jgi:hypothetical protein
MLGGVEEYCQNTQKARHGVKNTDKNRKNARKHQKIRI